MPKFVAAIDQGTTSTRCILFDHAGNIAAVDQKEHEQIYPKPGWVEHDPIEIWRNTQEVIAGAVEKVVSGQSSAVSEIAAIGVTNQRETTVVWDKNTSQPVYNAIVWQDTRTDAICNELARDGGQDRLRAKTGLPLATYFSGPKVKWILDNIPGAREKAENGGLLFGNMDTWVIWNLTGAHVTDVTNASRTLLMDMHTLDWDEDILRLLGIPRAMLPKICSSSEIYGNVGAILRCPFVPQGMAQDRSGASGVLLGHERFQDGDQRREVILHSSPEDIQVDVKVGMNQPVTHADDVIPGNALQLIPRDF